MLAVRVGKPHIYFSVLFVLASNKKKAGKVWKSRPVFSEPEIAFQKYLNSNRTCDQGNID